MRRSLLPSTWVPFALAQALGSAGVGMSATISSLAVVETAGTDTVAGLAPTSIAVGAGLSTLASRLVIPRRGRQGTIILFFGLASVGALLCVAGTSFGALPALLVGCAFLGGGSVAGLATRFGAAELVDRRHATTVIGLVMWFSTIGVVAGPLLATALSARMLSSNLAGPFVGMAIVNACAALVVASGARHARTDRRDGGPTPRPNADDPSAAQAQRHGGRMARARQAVLVACCAHVCMTALMSMAPVHLQQEGSPGDTIGAVISLHLASMYVLSPLFGLLSKTWGAGRTQITGLTTLAVAAALLATTAGSWLFTLGLALLGLGWSCCIVGASSATAAPELTECQRSAVRSRMDAGILLGAATTAPLVGLGVASWGYPRMAAGTAGALVVLIIVIVIGRITSRPSRTALDR